MKKGRLTSFIGLENGKYAVYLRKTERPHMMVFRRNCPELKDAKLRHFKAHKPPVPRLAQLYKIKRVEVITAVQVSEEQSVSSA